MAKYFINVNTLEELRKQYKELLKKYHPDNGGSEEITKAVNAEYDQLFKVLKDRHESKSADGQKDTSNAKSDYSANMYDWENDQALREMLQRVINFDGIEIEIVGQWIWISGNTYTYKKDLKNVGFKWASQKKQWYWHSEAFRKRSHRTLSMEDIRSYYGSTRVNTMQMALEAQICRQTYKI